MRFSILLTLLLITFSVGAQNDSSLVPEKSNKYITVGVFGNSTFINYRAYRSAATAIRLGVDAVYDEFEEETKYLDFPSAKRKTRNIQANINLGIQTKILRLPRLETYIGADVSVGIANFLNYSETNKYVYDSSADAYSFEYRQEETISGSYISPALRPFIGANFFVYKGLSLGVEYRVPLIARYYQISSVYSVVYKDLLGNIIDMPVSYPYSSSRTIARAHYGIVGNTSVTVSFRIR